jgi:hypothetical protein
LTREGAVRVPARPFGLRRPAARGRQPGQPRALLRGNPHRAWDLGPEHLVLSLEVLDLAAEVIRTGPSQDPEQSEESAAVTFPLEPSPSGALDFDLDQEDPGL